MQQGEGIMAGQPASLSASSPHDLCCEPVEPVTPVTARHRPSEPRRRAVGGRYEPAPVWVGERLRVLGRFEGHGQVWESLVSCLHFRA